MAHRANALNSDKAVESLLSLRLCLNLKQAVGSENAYGVLNVFVETVINKLSRMSLRKNEVEKISICFS